jgi:hypothetical protein
MALARKSQLPLRKRSESASIPASGDEGLNPRSGVELVGSNSGPTSQPSNQSPPCAGNGNFPRRDRPAKAGSSPSRDTLRDAPEARKPRFPRAKCEITCEGPNPKTGWWRHQGSNLGPNHAVIEPVSPLRREREFPKQRRGARKGHSSLTETESETRRMPEKPIPAP